MTEPTRDALHERTLEMLCEEAREYGTRMKSAYPEERAALAEEYAYAAERVRVRAELEAEVERLREDANLMRWLFDEMGGGFTHDEESYGMMCGKWGKWPDDWRDALHKARAAYAAATREGADV